MSRILLVLGAAVALTVVLPLFQQIPDGHKPVSTKADFITDSTPIPNYHMVFSTSCSPQQHWESMVFFYHAHKVKQPGTVTRIVSGCHEKDQLQSFHDQYSAVLNANFLLHETPDFSRIALTEGKHSYKYMNKPYGLQHWLDSHPELPDDDILMLLDPDMVLLRPLTHVFTSPTDQIIASEQSKVVVRHGHPVAQQDGYLDSAWTRLNVTYIANTTTPVPLPKASEGRLYWNSGPPYLMTIRDARRLAATWADYAPRVLDLYPKLFAEMFGYIHAAVQLNLPHTLVKSMVVSTTKSRDREGWSLIDALPDDRLCDPPVDAPMPIGLHYCKRYLLGKQFFSKYRMKKNIMDCDKPLLQLPENLFGKVDYGIFPPKASLEDVATYEESNRITIASRQAKREMFMLCAMTKSVNEALRNHKSIACGNDANYDEVYNVYDDPKSS